MTQREEIEQLKKEVQSMRELVQWTYRMVTRLALQSRGDAQ